MFKENYVISGTILCETGLHIGGSNDSVEIGGSDNVVIRDGLTNYPYIPGSSLKGKLRSLIELNDDKFVKNLIAKEKKEKIPYEDYVSTAVKIFGGAVDEGTIDFPTRIIVRDSYPTEETIEKWKQYDDVINGAELKYENRLSRINAKANPRNIERVPKSSEFNFEIVFSVYDEDEKNNILEIFNAMSLLEDNYLGGSGSRGFGQVRFKNISVVKRNQSYYKDNISEEDIIPKSSPLDLSDARVEVSEKINQ